MATKRRHSPELVSNPFIKKRNLEWSFELSGSTHNESSSSSSSSSSREPAEHQTPGSDEAGLPTTAAVEAGKAKIDDHLSYFSSRLAQATLSPFPPDTTRLSIEAYRRLYEAHAGSPRGAHFVIHQHDHPVAGTHYDLRLQINETSSASWAIMYGLPGNPNSRRLNRNATETRVHCLWNHLIETASAATGSLLIWDAGTYTVLPHPHHHQQEPDSQSSSSPSSEEHDPAAAVDAQTEQQKLHAAFQARKIRVRLAGTRLPNPYVLNLRLPHAEATAKERAPLPRRNRKRRRRSGPSFPSSSATAYQTTDSDSDSGVDSDAGIVPPPPPLPPPPPQEGQGGKKKGEKEARPSATECELKEEEEDEEDAHVRQRNAYAGAANSIGSVHQRRWYASLDRAGSGLSARRRGRGRMIWESAADPGDGDGDGDRDGDGEGHGNRLAFPFCVRGPPVERSVVTGRRGADVLADEGVVGFIGRRGWRPVLD
ncbi:DNA polymerase ligase-domain-containing protein [Xylariaceae sp. FL0662B]|nr:DNA polymerase ligase-domain-containing protein [Xylariaceae sp. FL0662B]